MGISLERRVKALEAATGADDPLTAEAKAALAELTVAQRSGLREILEAIEAGHITPDEGETRLAALF